MQVVYCCCCVGSEGICLIKLNLIKECASCFVVAVQGVGVCLIMNHVCLDICRHKCVAFFVVVLLLQCFGVEGGTFNIGMNCLFPLLMCVGSMGRYV